jgi:hypothetical protein
MKFGGTRKKAMRDKCNAENRDRNAKATNDVWPLPEQQEQLAQQQRTGNVAAALKKSIRGRDGHSPDTL